MRNHKLTYFKDNKKEWRWHLKAPNGRIVACSGEGYKRKRDCENGFHSAEDALFNTNYTIEI